MQSGPVASLHDFSELTCANIVSNLVIDREIIPARGEVFSESQEITDALERFWKHEDAGLNENEKENEKIDENKVTETNMQMKDGRYSVSLTGKGNISKTSPSDFEVCKDRLNSLFNKLKLKPDLLKQYDDIFHEQMSSRIIEEVPEAELSKSGACSLSHFCVVRADRETTKLRIVFDGSAKSDKESFSLNECLEVGTNYMPLLFDTQIRFRSQAIGITADIEKTFLQVEIDESDRDVLRFLWYDDVTKPKPSVVQYRYVVFCLDYPVVPPC